MDSVMASRIRLAWAATALVGLLGGCLDQRLNRDRYRAIRGDTPPQPMPSLQIPTPPTAILAAGDTGVRPGTYAAPAMQTSQPVQPAVLAQAPGTSAAPVQPASFAQPLLPSPQNASSETQTPMGNPLRLLYEKAARRWGTIDSYMVRLKRREVVAGKPQPEELMLVKFRKEPFSIYFKWLGPQSKGREVLYVHGRYDNQILTLNSAGDVPLMPASFVLRTATDSPLVRARSRYPLTEAGFGSTIQRFGSLVERNERGDGSWGTLKYQGLVRRPEYERPVEEVVQILPPKCDPLLPGGGVRHWFFDQECNMPLLIIARDQTGHEVEYYCHDRFVCPAHLDDNDFNPDRLWKKS
jgi:hypothetical protein